MGKGKDTRGSIPVSYTHLVGSPQIRNMGTLGGNIMNASPAADSLPALVALEARVILRSASGKRELKLEDFITGPSQTQIMPGELLTGVVVTKMQNGEIFKYKKIGQRKALAISIASCAVKMEYDPVSGLSLIHILKLKVF